MSQQKKTSIRVSLNSWVGVVGVAVILATLAFVGVRLISGHSLGLWTFVSSRIRFASSLGRAALDSRSVTANNQGNHTNIVFLHHSTGSNLIEQGYIRRLFSEAGYEFWDHGYNLQGLRRPDGSETGYSYNVPDDNTDPDGLASIFSQRAYSLPLNTFSGLLQHEVIIFKSCFPVCNIANDDQFEQYKEYYRHMRDVMDQYLGKVFIVVTPPPLNPASTDPEAAARARALADWLGSDEYLKGHSNVFTFDFFNHLAEGDPASPEYNMLRAEYREGTDSHPNRMANEALGPLFVDFIIDVL